ncbi:putative 2,3-dihydroxybiphenyl-1,2-dioxygenase or glyoxalase/bleomycin resistance protein-like protein [Ilyonectria robusta]|uniref:putative 2,3-dihydroxybiphenyl-1,2-dioxygenase or glyoxalase/bleomycin resistance protein-like protein n=1 Tax=Ilyonectria robusta TaxID=1079257 RepID=UPI001E8E5646|nr:putative 2,3-dihydroxybiphenyl-1,2-dioxygenase or glyoxalase/bleomycin resistance protein-like protein [Ilyonectria robusta]KAH8648844.1 putative 2,3-dihydroxybiphenyl-1,2-dioxygenase or glyoxalase/bleomycin resistance protein-like protein [Ilyonectria robusta]
MTAPPPILLDRLAHVCYQHPDLNEAKRFLLDFGLLVEKEEPDRIFFRGYGPEPVIYIATKGKRAFLGGTWVVQSMAELEKTVSYHNASRIQDMDAPGGGKYVTLRDPNDMVVRLVFGQTLRSAETYGAVIMNASSTKPRKGEFVRLKPGPSEVYKLGHYGFSVHLPHFMKVRNWYTTTFNLKVTDSVFDTSTNEDITSFLHIDKGAEFVDHHSIFFVTHTEDKPSHIHHSSFECNNFDTQQFGHDWLEKNGWKNCWGVGRHLLGSQIFDYWFDATGNVIEHYSDGDLVNCHTPLSREPAAPESLFVWGPNIPLAFLTGKVQDVVDKPGAQPFSAPSATG